jgi:radical SAM superfamily enzyme YgiQ (UPF0313 family)
MKKIVFINPSTRDTIFGQMKFLALPPMGLGVLASRTPDKYDITIVDENIEELDFNIEADLVAVTATTVQAPRAYEIITEFKSRGTTTVIGGIHPSVLPEEAAQFAHVVVVGEADELWAGILADFENQSLKERYVMEQFPSLDNMPALDRSLFSDDYVIHSVQTSRGCPCDCNFCSVTRFNGRKYRFRPVDQVLRDVAQIKHNRLFISDDSVVGLGNRCVDHARNLFDGLTGMKKSWGAQVCITIAEHDDLLRAASRSGANTFYIGFESVDPAALRSMDKGVNLRPKIAGYKEAIKKMHSYGIGVIGGFILGSDVDTKESFKITADFINETGIDGCQFTIMTPFPGTRLYRSMNEEGRLLYSDYPKDWARYNAYEAVMKPSSMTIHELVKGQQYMYDSTSSLGKSFNRGVRTLFSTKSPTNAFINFSWNYYNYRAIKNAF